MQVDSKRALLVLISAGTYFRGDRSDRISRVYIFGDSPSKCCKIPQNYLKTAEFSKITFFTGTNFRKLCQKPRNPRKLIPIRYVSSTSHLGTNAINEEFAVKC